ncbi:MAG: hypothetical protein ACAH83_14450 [Alphaproteobacteria bacterium]
MERNIEKSLQRGKYLLDPAAQGAEAFAPERGEVPLLSAYTLALRNPHLFSVRHGAAGRSVH